MSATNFLYALGMTGIDAISLPLMKAKHLGILKGAWLLPLAMIVYSLQPLIFYKSLSVENMGVMNILWNVTSDIVIALLGLVLFGEKLTSIQCFGIALSLTGITILGLH